MKQRFEHSRRRLTFTKHGVRREIAGVVLGIRESLVLIINPPKDSERQPCNNCGGGYKAHEDEFHTQ